MYFAASFSQSHAFEATYQNHIQDYEMDPDPDEGDEDIDISGVAVGLSPGACSGG